MRREQSSKQTDSAISVLLNAEELAKFLEVSTRTLWRLKSPAAIPQPVKFCGNIRWRASDIQTWLDDGCPETP